MSLVVMATGGTGGHIYPAVATARELMVRGHEALLLGQRGGMEERVAAEQGLAFHGVDAGKLARSGQGRPDPRELLRAGRGVAEARAFLKGAQPGAVVGFGGFASLPGVLAAQSLGLPTVLHEQNARLGLTQRLAAGRARA
ncbi:UDP-N-acetylglucosamine--N-acetylmuramyl-(pentapeptide) pyrophosphoryl-undecaprenol N-acetylglucosamine transferase, partial [Deinococcus phoenicis]|uniref:UDP-N-acetylglucosamine--N-acetylmuramyl- (pentapeptide) pyrophosphoryl-undecaprenol N-acetylglucosamine transferase n=1 Tax=Deinococcus phoenicis TaxID=1476583 RepID=UPI0005504006